MSFIMVIVTWATDMVRDRTSSEFTVQQTRYATLVHVSAHHS